MSPARLHHSQDSPGCIKYNVMDKSTVSYYWRMLIIAKQLEYKVNRIGTLFLLFQMHMFIIQICNHCVFAKQPKTSVYTALLKAFNGMGVSIFGRFLPMFWNRTAQYRSQVYDQTSIFL